MKYLCRECGKKKSLSGFYLFISGKSHLCKVCTRARVREYRAKNLETVKARNKKWRDSHAMELKIRHVRSVYNVDLMALWRSQRGVCAACGGAMLLRGAARNPKLASVDHDHRCCSRKKSCGKCVVGLVHYRCNYIMGVVRDDPKELRKLLRYLEITRG